MVGCRVDSNRHESCHIGVVYVNCDLPVSKNYKCAIPNGIQSLLLIFSRLNLKYDFLQ
jgi:hypothetical protein